MTSFDVSLAFFLRQVLVCVLEGRLCACEGIKSPTP